MTRFHTVGKKLIQEYEFYVEENKCIRFILGFYFTMGVKDVVSKRKGERKHDEEEISWVLCPGK